MRSYRMALGLNQKGYLIFLKLYINYFFMIPDDFTFSGLILKIKTNS
jgi:hypothetical protein